ncbi:MAG: c-type cytochrome, partial [Planctomycetota bacterium]
RAQARQDAIIVRAVERMKGFDYRSSPPVRDAVLRQIKRAEGTPEFVKLVKRFRPDGIEDRLAIGLLGDDQTAAVESAEMLLEMDKGRKIIRDALRDANAIKATTILGLVGNGRSSFMLSEIASDPDRSFEVRRSAVQALNRSSTGQRKLIELAKQKLLVGDTLLVAGAMLSRSKNENIRKSAMRLLPQPATKDTRPMPPVDELAKQTGDAERGQKLFRGAATCANCHVVDQFGKNVGPNLSEIGSKLSREALLTAILAPSAGISHNYENFVVMTDEGNVISGLKISETQDQIVIRTADAIDRKIPTETIEQMRKSDQSIMPENLHHITGQQGLVDVVEYMATLTKKR